MKIFEYISLIIIVPIVYIIWIITALIEDIINILKLPFNIQRFFDFLSSSRLNITQLNQFFYHPEELMDKDDDNKEEDKPRSIGF